MPHVGADELRLSALRAELLGKLLAGLAVASGDNDLVAFAREGQSCGAADSGERPGNQDNGHPVSYTHLTLPTILRV